MRSFVKWFCLVAAVVVAAIIVLFKVIPTPYERYYGQFTRERLIGLTKAEVLETVGQPGGTMDNGDAWNYQLGNRPGAVVLFTKGRVADVAEWKE
jgi:hypothetical protein